ncbi:MAG: hypothetical protein COU10_02300 [Candidatus Harrisonbacteria bacterium CG10_big_fil_rev_8_21_14_0_10_45_28]|uniref:Uncharacterized protein n=1 Tax=Candidatus Harrisonbacteria bacterium CG10_big_fil_rev_8_21_14_0_10_45_28 TaxID=1974586 RepID=A0A2H0UN68_9BACT|nr:MAG: hypothetical protein COU10_02300 [Candidatus Harrisonbacteria bacterium CG10_big_fil_rev_8_21_14_0_10_45_28]
MSTEIMVKKLNNEVKKLRKEVAEVKQLVFAIPADTEGEYKKSFIQKALTRAGSDRPAKSFISKADFLENVRKTG